MTQAVAAHDYLARAGKETAAQGVCPAQVVEAASEAALRRQYCSAATLAILLHVVFLLPAFWLGSGTGGVQRRNLPRFVSVSLEHWPSEHEAGRHEAVLSKKSALPLEKAAGQNRVVDSVRAEKSISKETPAQTGGEVGGEGNRLAQPEADANALASQGSSGPGSGTAETFAEVVARPLYEMNPPPLYPRLARRMGRQGLVLLEVFVSASGTAEEVKVANTSGHEILDEAALKAVRGWRFAPGLRNGRPTPMRVRVPVRFNLRAGS